MKKILITIFSLSVLFGCQSDEQYEDLNRDPKNPTDVAAEFLYNSATKSLVDQMTNTNVNNNIFRLLGQYWTETTYTDEANYDFTGRNIPQNHWSEMYRDVLLDFNTAKDVVNASALSQQQKNARLAQIEVLSIYTWQQLVDTFGDIPYTEALGDETLPAYDDAEAIYLSLLDRLDATIPNLTGTGFTSADNIYGGDMTAWNKFANSLKLKLGIRLSDFNTSLSQTIVEEAYSAGVFTSNADNALFQYESSTPNTNPLWVDLVQSGRSDFVAANTIVDVMNDLDDPRRSAYFDDNLGMNTYSGGIYGDNNSYNSYTHVGDLMLDPTLPGVLLDFAEVSFYLAEAAHRTWTVGGTAEQHYNNGITASFEFWNAGDVTSYLTNPEVAYTTAQGDWRQKIGTQFWLAMYNRGFEGWTVWRKYDNPTFNLPAVTSNPVPTRYTYPVNEQNLNETNWSAASAAIGGDEQTTKLFWDLN
ncbi:MULTISPECIES: SusD/RagB family nutrient-binding outer membrane lipoprotein [Mesoflavibacter]|uniref:SusD/RagB family nutrient-binding outer membrane lipoprotein n=1 Tax=Mesoflavibacter profundi TaxID=2708110 RepID=A0ABT4S385_9FLAO|nr:MULTISPECIES: SusD/RagB family nutrient-binding outer membrane lipoprotein [Mesoflavibacter]MDA0178538.1 SusD/RagB family nutrient-binding outer membrane lipoprotein [Mesoflavibacter profundi]QIJ89477.1 Cell surface glycan-binding lipoprotein [Mesoflavibacter sp. HG96]QIJ92205.1 Cell surface glycan-binding lipoprotein [Mesoflavibacter sp. HG37]